MASTSATSASTYKTAGGSSGRVSPPSYVQPRHARTPSSSTDGKRRAGNEIDQLEQLAGQVNQANQKRVVDALAGHGYSNMFSGFAARPTAQSSTPRPNPIIAAQVSQRLMGTQPSLPDSPNFDCRF